MVTDKYSKTDSSLGLTWLSFPSRFIPVISLEELTDGEVGFLALESIMSSVTAFFSNSKSMRALGGVQV
jgi:hypothetical protein